METSNPYVGLRSYEMGDRDLFYGRGREAQEVSALWKVKRLTVLHGHSGSGKTSLVQAGVIPQFDREAVDILPVARVSHGSAFPIAALPNHNPYTFALLSSWSPADSPTRLVDLSLTEFLRRRSTLDHPFATTRLTLAAIDQFEELFNYPHQRQRYVEEFIDHLIDAVDTLPNLRLLILIREEALPDLLPYESRLAKYSLGRFRIHSLTRDAALEVVKRPLEISGRSFAAGVAEKLVDDLLTIKIKDREGVATTIATDTLLPVQLQMVCTALWRVLRENVATITDEHIRYQLNVDRILTQFFTFMIAEVADEHGLPAQELREWLARTFITERGERATVDEGPSETNGMPNSIARALENRYILKSGQRLGGCFYQFQNDRMIESVRRASQSLACLDEIAKASPAGYLRAAENELAAGELELAEKRAKDAIGTCGRQDMRTQAEAESFLGNIAFRRDQLYEAERHYRRAAEYFETLQDQASVGQLLAAIGRILLARGSYPDAVDQLQSAVQRLQGDLTMQVELARALWSSGQPQAAAAIFGSVLTIAPDAAEALAGRGQIRIELDDPISAFDDLGNLSRLRPDIGRRADVRSARALTLARLGRIREALSEADAALAGAPDSGPVLLRASRVARVAGGLSRADDLLRRARDAQEPALVPHQLAEVLRLLASTADDTPES